MNKQNNLCDQIQSEDTGQAAECNAPVCAWICSSVRAAGRTPPPGSRAHDAAHKDAHHGWEAAQRRAQIQTSRAEQSGLLAFLGSQHKLCHMPAPNEHKHACPADAETSSCLGYFKHDTWTPRGGRPLPRDRHLEETVGGAACRPAQLSGSEGPCTPLRLARSEHFPPTPWVLGAAIVEVSRGDAPSRNLTPERADSLAGSRAEPPDALQSPDSELGTLGVHRGGRLISRRPPRVEPRLAHHVALLPGAR